MTLCWPAWGSTATLPASLGCPIWSSAQIPGTACEDLRTHGIHRTQAESYSSLSQLTIPNSEKSMRSFRRNATSEGTSGHPGEAAEPVAMVISRQTEGFQIFTTPNLLVHKREALEFDGSGVL